ncbi:MAG: class I SAM-dependent methyltransferase [Bacteroidales bacterium]|nr:class I SAM-dependent methyltransferase [Bacteroidales bacterium]
MPNWDWESRMRHYNLGNDLFEAMPDKRLTYCCGYWKNANYTICTHQNWKKSSSLQDIKLQL